MILNTQYAVKSFSDIIDIDAINHFSIYSLNKVLSLYFNNYFVEDMKNGELVAMSSDKLQYSNQIVSDDLLENVKMFNKMIDFLINYKYKLVIFGTSPLSIFIAKLIEHRLEFFLDEDINRIGQIILNKKVILPDKCNDKKDVFLPFIENVINQKMKKRYKHINFITIFDIC